MSNYYIGVDIGIEDAPMVSICKRPNRFMRFYNRLLKRGDSWKIVYCGTDLSQIKRYKYRGAKVTE